MNHEKPEKKVLKYKLTEIVFNLSILLSVIKKQYV
ncbi:hypothetical protein PRO82_000640 [Candidatus Protochlamydia amoebophila]|nr:hypothetical protein [Candidatus Protochlamydia amoebophila]